MTKKDFFRILIKVFALFMTISVLYKTIPMLLSCLKDRDMLSTIEVAFGCGTGIALFVVLTLHPDFFIRLLKLDKGFDDDLFSLGGFDSSSMLKLGSIIVGGFLFIDNIGPFINYTYYAFAYHVTGPDFTLRQDVSWATSALNLTLGVLLVTKYEAVAGFLKKDAKTEQ